MMKVAHQRNIIFFFIFSMSLAVFTGCSKEPEEQVPIAPPTVTPLPVRVITQVPAESKTPLPYSSVMDLSRTYLISFPSDFTNCSITEEDSIIKEVYTTSLNDAELTIMYSVILVPDFSAIEDLSRYQVEKICLPLNYFYQDAPGETDINLIVMLKSKKSTGYSFEITELDQ